MSDLSGELQNANEVASESAALADHLARSGVLFLPKANPEAAASMSVVFETSSTETSVAETAEIDAVDLAGTESIARQAATVQSTQTPVADASRQSSSLTPQKVPAKPYEGEPLPILERQTQLDALRAQVANCSQCEVLAGCRSNTVFGEGNASPRVVFFGVGPGPEEDRSGQPFVDKAGRLLTKMIEACKFRRQDVYLMNAIKCRPPGDRIPQTDELQNCRQFYEQQLQILRPEYIVCLGAISSQELLKSKLPIGRLRGTFHDYHGSKVIVTYHPTYLDRTPTAKKAAWEDLQLMLRDAGIQV